MGGQVAVLTVNRHEVLRPHQAQHQLEFLLAGMPVDMDRRDAVVEHLGALPKQIVDRMTDWEFVAWDGSGRDHHGVSGHYIYVAVLLLGYPDQG